MSTGETQSDWPTVYTRYHTVVRGFKTLASTMVGFIITGLVGGHGRNNNNVM